MGNSELDDMLRAQVEQEQQEMIVDALMRCKAAGAAPEALATLAAACGVGRVWNTPPQHDTTRQGTLSW